MISTSSAVKAAKLSAYATQLTKNVIWFKPENTSSGYIFKCSDENFDVNIFNRCRKPILRDLNLIIKNNKIYNLKLRSKLRL